jgi:hypothetical protein
MKRPVYFWKHFSFYLPHFNHALQLEWLELNCLHKRNVRKSQTANEWQVSICPPAREQDMRGSEGVSSLILNLSTT